MCKRDTGNWKYIGWDNLEKHQIPIMIFSNFKGLNETRKNKRDLKEIIKNASCQTIESKLMHVIHD